MMYVILLELNARPANQYEDMERAIKALGDWSNRVSGQWLVQSRFPASQIRDLLKPHLGNGDKLFVARIFGNWSATNMGTGFQDWMNRRNFDVPPARPNSGLK
jgi:hypothetical protein